jgi:hypothetical protein
MVLLNVPTITLHGTTTQKTTIPVGRPRHRWYDIKVNIQETGCVNWIQLAQDRVQW